jgi:hypothetical protein
MGDQEQQMAWFIDYDSNIYNTESGCPWADKLEVEGDTVIALGPDEGPDGRAVLDTFTAYPSLRALMAVIEEATNQKLYPSDRDIAAAMISNRNDLREVLRSGLWDEMHPEEIIDVPDVPTDPRHLTDWQINAMIEAMEPRLTKARTLLANIAIKGPIPITRRIAEPFDQTKSIGVHWSYGEAPNPHTAERGDFVAFATVDPSDVDWAASTARAVFWWLEEREITIKPNAVLHDLRFEAVTEEDEATHSFGR